MLFPKTTNCVICGKPAVLWTGHVIAYQRMALGNLVPVKIVAGYCDADIAKSETFVSGSEYKPEYGISDFDIMERPMPREEYFFHDNGGKDGLGHVVIGEASRL